MTKNTKTYVMVDNINMGTRMDTDDPDFESNGIECQTRESESLRRAMMKCGAEVDKEGSVTVFMNPANIKGLGSTITVLLRKDARRGSSWFFNVHANPASVFSGDNTFGNLKLKTQVQDIFNFVLDYLGKKGATVGRLMKQVQIGNIYVQSVTFAQYSSAVKSEELVKELVNRWYFMYETRIHTGERYVSLLQELALKRSVGDQYEDSISLSIHAPGDKLCKGHKLMHLCLYNKAQEKRARGVLEEESVEAEDLERRLRFDLTISNYFLKTHWNLERLTLRELYGYVKRKWPERGWKGAVEDLMTYAIKRTCLSYMMTVANPFLLQHKEMVSLWEHGRNGRKWDPQLKSWADSLDINLDISPDAHLIMLQGQAGLLMNTRDNAKRWLGSSKGAEKYLADLSSILTRTRESKRLAKAAASLKLDFSRPTYVEQPK